MDSVNTEGGYKVKKVFTVQPLNTMAFCLLMLFLLSPLQIGAMRGWVWLIISGLCFLMMAYWCLLFIRGKVCIPPCLYVVPVRITLGLFFCATMWEFIQNCPMPFTWMAKLSEPTAALYSHASAVVLQQANPEIISMSVDSSLASAITLRSAAYFCLFFLLLTVIDSRSRLQLLCYVIVFSGLFQAAYGSFMTLSGFEYMLGEKKYSYVGYATGTFYGRNHFAGYLEMALATGMGLLIAGKKNQSKNAGLRWRGKLRKLLSLVLSGKAVLRLMLVIMVIGLILSRSRMGNAAFFNSLLVTGVIALFFSPSFRRPGVYGLLISIIVIDVFLLGSWFGLEKVVERMEQTSMVSDSRDEVGQTALAIISDFGWTGTGAGTFHYLSPSYEKEQIGSIAFHAMNDYLEILSDLGFPGFSCLTGVVLISLWQAITALRYRSSSFVRGMGFAGFMGTLSLLIHSSVDYNLQIPANAMLFIAMLAIPIIALSVDKNQPKQSHEFAY